MRLVLLFALVALPFGTFGQETGLAGTYEVRYETTDGNTFLYEITLHPDNTFLFHSYEYHAKAQPPEKERFGKGRWEANKNLIVLSTNEENDLDDTHTLNLDKTKARIDRKSPRNKNPNPVPDVMRIYESPVPWVKGKKLTKVSR
ncbi:MAG: hypothetical protein AAF466_06310 [Bacteroidota bacterium]